MQLVNQQGESIEHAFLPGSKKDTLVLIGHGVTGDMHRELITSLASQLSREGWATLRFSFSGNGNSEGAFVDSSVTKGCTDLLAILDCVGKQADFKTIVYIGYSMGGASGTLAASKDKRIKVLVSLAGMVDTKAFCETEFGEVVPDEGYMWDDESKPLSSQFVSDLTQISSTLPYASTIQQPWLIIHGDQDDVVLPQDSENLYAHLTGPKKHELIQGTDHSFQGHWEKLGKLINHWLNEYIS